MSLPNTCPITGLPITARAQWGDTDATGQPRLRVERIGDAMIVVYQSGTLDQATAQALVALVAALRDPAPALNPACLLLDFSQAIDLAASVRRWLVRRLATHIRAGGHVVFVGLTARLAHHLHLAHLLRAGMGRVHSAPDYARAVPRHLAPVVELQTALEQATAQARAAQQEKLAAQEQLSELTLSLLQAKQEAEARLHEIESLLAGVRELTLATSPEEVYATALRILQPILEFQHAFILVPDQTGGWIPVASTSPIFATARWAPSRLMARVTVGHLVAVYDTQQVPAWCVLPDALRAQAVAALHIPLAAGQTQSILICTHPERGYFTQRHVRLAQRFAVFAASALVNAGLHSAVRQERDTLEARVQERTRELAASTAEARKLSQVAAHTHNLVIISDAQGRIDWVNEAFTRVTGYRLDEVAGKTPDLVLHGPETDPATVAHMHACLHQGQGFTVEILHYRRSGEAFWASVEVQPIHDETGKLTSFVAIHTDITERRQLARTLQAQRDFALQVMDTMGQGLTITDDRVVFEYVNPAYADMLGYRPQELIGKTPYDVTVAGDHTTLDYARAQRQRGASGAYENKLRHADGSTVDVLITAVPRLRAGKPDGAIAVITDLTERKRLEQALAQARDQAIETARLKSEFLAMMSHEIRTPLNGVLGLAEQLLYTELDAEQREFVTLMNSEGQTLLRILNDILDLSKLEAGRMLLETVAFDPRQVVRRVQTLLRPKVAEKGLDFIVTLDPAIPAYVLGDADRLYQVLLNLTANAVKFTEHGTIRVAALLQESDPHQLRLRFTVTDTGIGLSSHAMSRLFQPFSQADNSRRRRYEGTGLGLVISKRLVGLMGGEIGAQGVEDEGATFWFSAGFPRIGAAAWDDLGPLHRRLFDLRVMFVGGDRRDWAAIHSTLAAWRIATVHAPDSASAQRLMAEAGAAGAPITDILLATDLLWLDTLVATLGQRAASPRLHRLGSGRPTPVGISSAALLTSDIADPTNPSDLLEALLVAPQQADPAARA